MASAQHTGKVIFASAGPGDPELITLKAVRYLKLAEVVLTDRLVSPQIIKQHVNKKAEVIYVGKQSGKAASVKQSEINQLLLKHARAGKFVVRLKGGDVSIFSNILDELEALTQYRIPFEIIPGVSAALGAAAYSGIPLTARGYAVAVRFLAYHKLDLFTEKYWEELAQTNDTLVFYMSAESLNDVAAKLTEKNISGDKLLAVIEQATTPLQNVFVSDIYQFAEQKTSQTFASPSLLIIGRVVALHRQFKWLSNSNSKDHYFKPVGELPVFNS